MNEETPQGKYSYVNRKIQKISKGMDRRDFWMYIALLGLMGVMMAGAVYYFAI